MHTSVLSSSSSSSTMDFRVIFVLTAGLFASQAIGYQVVMTAYEIDRTASTLEYMTWHEGRIGRFNRSSQVYVFNGRASILKNFPDRAWVDVIAYQLLNTNAYSKIPVKLIGGYLCDFFDRERFFYDDLLRYSNLPQKCPVEAGEYEIKDYNPDQGVLPPELPGNDWKMDFVVKTNQTGALILSNTIYLHIDRNVEVPKSRKSLEHSL